MLQSSDVRTSGMCHGRVPDRTHEYFFQKNAQCKPFFASPREKSRMKVPWPDLDREPPNSVGTYTRAMRAIDNDPRCLSEVRGTEPRPMVASFAAATKGALVVPACLSTSRA